jgi:hypothetical protein
MTEPVGGDGLKQFSSLFLLYLGLIISEICVFLNVYTNQYCPK